MSAHSLKEVFFSFFFAGYVPKGFFLHLVRDLENWKICDNCAATDAQFIMLGVHAESSCIKNITTIIFYKLGAK